MATSIVTAAVARKPSAVAVRVPPAMTNVGAVVAGTVGGGTSGG